MIEVIEHKVLIGATVDQETADKFYKAIGQAEPEEVIKDLIVALIQGEINI